MLPAGKLVFSRGDVTAIADLAVKRFGAAGIIVDNMREHLPVRDRFDLPDGRQYLSFWPASIKDHKAYGFVISPRQGENLRKHFASGKKELHAYARVISRFYDGSMEVVTAVIPGKGEGEVVAMAHLCHPESSANDNASGCGVLMEVARSLSRLIQEGRLPRPERTIRFLWLPEMTGSYAYLASHESQINKIVAGINLDMVGENQDLCKSIFLVEKPPRALAGFGGDLAEMILRMLTREVTNLAGTASNATFRWAVTPFSGGSDHAIWSDPTVGVTCPMLIQWPDRFYHTSEDTIDKVDPAMLGLAGMITATYLHTVASAEVQDAIWLAGEMAAVFPHELNQLLEEILSRTMTSYRAAASAESRAEILAKARRQVERRIAFQVERKIEDVKSLLKLAEESNEFASARAEASRFIRQTGEFQKERALRTLAALTGVKTIEDLPPSWSPPKCEAAQKARRMAPERIYRGPFSPTASALPEGFQKELEDFKKKHPVEIPAAFLQYWSDGRRSLAEVADLVEGETGFCDIEALVDFVELMAKRGVYRIGERVGVDVG